MEDYNFYLAQFQEKGGKIMKMVVVADSMGEVTRFLLARKIDRPKIRAMSQPEFKKWRGKTFYVEDFSKRG